MSDANLGMLEVAASRLQVLLSDVVFVGGAMLGLLIDDPGSAPVRATTDVDVIAEITTYLDYVAFSDRLREYGFTEDNREGAPLCRWLHGDLTLDVMPLNQEVLGFSNRWYRGALETSRLLMLPSGTPIRAITAPHFLGTKIEAFRGRGNRDFMASRDLEDFVAVIDGHEVILEELSSAPHELRVYLAEAARELLSEPRFMEVLPGYFLPDEISQRRLPGVLRKLRTISGQ